MPKADKFERELVFGDPDFPLDVSTWDNHPDYPMILHDFCEIVVVLRGTATKLVGNQRFPLKAGDVLVLDGRLPNGYRDTKDLTVINISYDHLMLESVAYDVAGLPGYQALFVVEPAMRAHSKYERVMHLDMEQLEEIRRLAQAIEKELHPEEVRRPAVHFQDRQLTAASASLAPEPDRGCRFMAMAQFMMLVGLLSRWRFSRPALESEKIMNIGRAIGHMESHFDEPIDPVVLARMVGMSARSFYRMFNHVTQQTPTSYLQRLRLTKAAQLLQTTDRTVTEIAFQCGFEDSSYFARCFRQRFGVAPRSFKRRGQD